MQPQASETEAEGEQPARKELENRTLDVEKLCDDVEGKFIFPQGRD